MNNGSPLVNRFLRPALRKFKNRKYRKIKEYVANFDDITVKFTTADEYSNSWFFPRYLRGGIHENFVTEMLISAMKHANVFVDIGSNLGWYTCVAAKHMPQGSIYAFEMDDLNFDLLQRNLAINNVSNVKAHNVAISDSPGVARYKRDTYRPSPTFRLQELAEYDEAPEIVSVTSVTLDGFLKDRRTVPDVIKIDVEGAEMNVLMGMRRVLREYTPHIFLEVHPANLHYFGASMHQLLSLLIRNNYVVFEVEGIRSQKSEGSLRPLRENSVVADNTMIYAAKQPLRDVGQMLAYYA